MAKSISIPLTFILKKDPESGWYSSKIKEFPQAISQGKTKRDAMINVIDAFGEFIAMIKEGEQGPFTPVGTFEEFKKDVFSVSGKTKC